MASAAMPTPQKLAISISDSQLDLETEIDPDWERLIGSPRFEAARHDGTTALAFSPNATNAIARVPANTIAAGEYVFSVLVKKDDRNDTATTTVVVTQGDPPVVSIAALSYG